MSNAPDPRQARWGVYSALFGFLIGLTFTLLGRMGDAEKRIEALEKAIKVEAPK